VERPPVWEASETERAHSEDHRNVCDSLIAMPELTYFVPSFVSFP